MESASSDLAEMKSIKKLIFKTNFFALNKFRLKHFKANMKMEHKANFYRPGIENYTGTTR
jgi:hypothetical protein